MATAVAQAQAPSCQQPQPQARRFESDRILGTGTYGQVIRCKDNLHHRMVAVKIAKPEAPYRRSAQNEIYTLSNLQHCDRVLRFFESFEHDGRIHIVCELLEKNLYEALKDARFMRMPLAKVRMIAESVLMAISELHAIGYMHCDIKPENVMQRGKGESASDIIMIDFGSVRKITENQYYDVQSLWYRAPEVMCGLPYSPAIDSWSIGCLLYELHTGAPLFPGESERDSMAQIVAVVGRPSQTAMARGTKSMTFDFEPSSTVDPFVLQNNLDGNPNEVVMFRDLLMRLLCPDEAQRLSARDALNHPFMRYQEAPTTSPFRISASSELFAMEPQNSTVSTHWLSNGTPSTDDDENTPTKKYLSPPVAIEEWDCI